MGLMDFLRRKKPDSGRPEVAAHDYRYAFAHVAMRQVALADPLRYLAILGSEQGQEFIADMIRAVAENVKGPGPDFTAADVHVHLGRVGQHPCAILEMPKPLEVPEAFFTATVALVDIDAPSEPREGTKIAARYFTLEKGFADEGGGRTVFCEWTESAHLNFGDGPPATVQDFVAAIEKALAPNN
jgi:hypothetical protein